MNRGLFVIFEGIDGSGTTTQVRAVVDRLNAMGHAAYATCEPSRGPIGVFIRQILTRSVLVDAGEIASFDWQTMALLFAADRLDHVEREVLPALREGKIVISDRYLLSSLAYQSATAENAKMAVSFVRTVNQEAQVPDLQIVFDVDADVARERRAARGGQAELYERDELQRRLASLYKNPEALAPPGALIHVDAHLPISELTERIVERIVSFHSSA